MRSLAVALPLAAATGFAVWLFMRNDAAPLPREENEFAAEEPASPPDAAQRSTGAIPERSAAPTPSRPSPTPPLDERTQQSIGQIAGFANAEEARLAALAAADHATFAQLWREYETWSTEAGRLETRLHEHTMRIAEQRWANGQFEIVDKDGPIPPATSRFEVVQSSIIWEPVRQKDIRRIVRIRSGDDPAFDALRTETDMAKRDLHDAVDRFLVAHGH